jgi:predicted LPLAT superfamily acyltransferase
MVSLFEKYDYKKMKETKQRGSGWSIALVYNLYKLFGYRFIYLLMYPVTFFYFLFATNVKESLQSYYKHIDKEFTLKIYFEHLRIFANCLVDRFITKLTEEEYIFEYEDIDTPTKVLENGCILLHSHFGGWAASANMAHITNKIHIVMQEVLLKSMKKIENSKSCKQNLHIIDLNEGGISVSIKIANALLQNDIVAMMGDRASNEKGKIALKFFKKPADFNKNPFQIAYKTNKPILVYFIIFQSMKKYKVEYLVIELDKNLQEDEAILEAMEKYIKKYEQIIEAYPNQWFNFYNFWKR